MPPEIAEAKGGEDQPPTAGLAPFEPEARKMPASEGESVEERAQKLVSCINASSWFPALDEEWPRHCAQAAAMGLELRLLDPEVEAAERSNTTVRMAELREIGAGKVFGLVDFRTYDARLWLADDVTVPAARSLAGA